jgi:hypothetical protein
MFNQFLSGRWLRRFDRRSIVSDRFAWTIFRRQSRACCFIGCLGLAIDNGLADIVIATEN